MAIGRRPLESHIGPFAASIPEGGVRPGMVLTVNQGVNGHAGCLKWV